LLQWSEEETDSAKRIDFYSYGDSAGMKFCNWQPDFPFNDSLAGFNLVQFKIIAI
jgi:hypothetical protein